MIDIITKSAPQPNAYKLFIRKKNNKGTR